MMDDLRMEATFEENFITSSDMIEDVDTYSPIKNYLKGKTVFITGGFGFIGKLLVEKLLRCDAKKIYLFVRAKKGKSVEERFEKLMSEPVIKHRVRKINLLNGFSHPGLYQTPQAKG